MSQWRNADPKIGEAWAIHRRGDHPGAIKKFEEAIKVVPHSADAHYGLALALRADGQNEKAIDAFRQSLEIAENKLSAVRNLDDVDDQVRNNLDTIEDDRYLMLSRMIKQRLHELGVEQKLAGVIT